MITFKPNDDDEFFLSIVVLDGSDVNKIKDRLQKVYPKLKADFYQSDFEELIYKISNTGYGFSLNELRSTLKGICQARVTTFCVDIDTPTQRYNG